MNKKMINNDGSNSSSNIEEFSFPVIYNNPLSSFMLSSSSSSSSSLWRVSSRVYHHQDSYDEDYCMEVRSLCEEILPSNKTKELEVEERMDYLWEGFNEEEVEKDRECIGGEIMSRVLKMSKTRRNGNVEYEERFCGWNKIDNSNVSSSKRLVIISKLLKGFVSVKKSAYQLRLLKSRF